MTLKNRLKIMSVILLPWIFAGQLMALPAFPGAEGAGADTVGGRGGKVIEVTNLNDSGPGSLRAAVEASGPRIVVFKVAGLVTLESTLYINNPYITIAGQTAPDGGITIKGHHFYLQTHDVIMRYLKLREGSHIGSSRKEHSGAQGLSIGVGGGVYNVIFDHLSTSWTNAKNVALWSSFKPAHDITFQWNIFAEGLNYDGAASGFLTGSSSNPDDIKGIAIHHNYFAHFSNRMPLIKIKEAKVVNNIIYNWQWWATSVYGNSFTDIIGNMYKKGPLNVNNAAKDLEFDFRRSYDGGAHGPLGDPQIYLSGNRGPSNPTGTDANNAQWKMTHSGTVFKRSDHTPLSLYTIPITIDPVDSMIKEVLEKAGAYQRINEKGQWVANRDTIDKRQIKEYFSGTGGYPKRETDVGGYIISYPWGKGYKDSDHDGMSDVWEQMYHLNPHNAGDGSQDQDSDGYTNVEEFINGTNPIIINICE